MNVYLIQNQNDNLLDKIAQSSELTAYNTTLGAFDWISLIIAAIALIVAFVSLYYAVVTLSISKEALYSQERTERNTRRISFNTQSDLLSALMADTFNRFAKVCAITIYLNKHKYTCHPNKAYINDLKLSLTYIQENSDTNDNNDVYIALAMLKETIADYNEMLITYANEISDVEYTQEQKMNSIYSILGDLLRITSCICDLFKNYYHNTSGDNLNRIFSLPTMEIHDVPTYAINHKLNVDINSGLYLISSEYIAQILSGKNYFHDNRSVTPEVLKNHLVKVTANNLKTMQTSFYDYEVDLTVVGNYITTWVGLLLPVPSISKTDKYNFGKIELYIYKNELRLYSYNGCLVEPSITFIKQDKSEIFKFIEVKDEKRINTQYYAIECQKLVSIIEDYMTYDECIISYIPMHIPSIISHEETVSDRYRISIPMSVFHDKVYCMRISDDEYDFYNATHPTEDNISEGTYDILQNEDGELLLVIKARKGVPDNPKLIIDYHHNLILYRNRESSVILGGVCLEAYDAILKNSDILIAETEGEEVRREYHAPILLIKSCEIFDNIYTD